MSAKTPTRTQINALKNAIKQLRKRVKTLENRPPQIISYRPNYLL